MTLETGILGYLAASPLSGYDIKKLFNSTALYFWPADQAQIYRSLKKMLKAGLVRLEKTEKGQTVNRKIYGITPKGRETLRRQILNTEFNDFMIRSPQIMQLLFSGNLSREEQLGLIDEHIKHNDKLLKVLKTNYERITGAYRQLGGDTLKNSHFTSANYVYRWGIIRGTAYRDFLKVIKGEIMVDDLH